MKRTYFLFLGIIICCTFQAINAQQADRIQRGQRGYTPPPKINYETYIELKDPYEATSIILPKCVEAFKLDTFEKEIVKSSLLKRFESQNMILGNKDNSSDDKKKALIEIDKNFYKELALILSAEEIEQFKVMDFSETREEKKQKKKKKKKKKEKQKQKN